MQLPRIVFFRLSTPVSPEYLELQYWRFHVLSSAIRMLLAKKLVIKPDEFPNLRETCYDDISSNFDH